MHCVQGTPGAQLVSGLDVPADAEIVKKGTQPGEDGYSGFEGVNDHGNSLLEILRAHAVRRVYVCGIATDYCVLATALDAVKEGYEVHVLPDLIAGVDASTSTKAIEQMKANGVKIY